MTDENCDEDGKVKKWRRIPSDGRPAVKAIWKLLRPDATLSVLKEMVRDIYIAMSVSRENSIVHTHARLASGPVANQMDKDAYNELATALRKVREVSQDLPQMVGPGSEFRTGWLENPAWTAFLTEAAKFERAAADYAKVALPRQGGRGGQRKILQKRIAARHAIDLARKYSPDLPEKMQRSIAAMLLGYTNPTVSQELEFKEFVSVMRRSYGATSTLDPNAYFPDRKQPRK